jgi:hypothetical protein
MHRRALVESCPIFRLLLSRAYPCSSRATLDGTSEAHKGRDCNPRTIRKVKATRVNQKRAIGRPYRHTVNAEGGVERVPRVACSLQLLHGPTTMLAALADCCREKRARTLDVNSQVGKVQEQDRGVTQKSRAHRLSQVAEQLKKILRRAGLEK